MHMNTKVFSAQSEKFIKLLPDQLKAAESKNRLLIQVKWFNLKTSAISAWLWNAPWDLAFRVGVCIKIAQFEALTIIKCIYISCAVLSGLLS